MPKINQEEYEVLKALDDKWKWIARDKNGGLYKFQEKPKKVNSFRWNDRNQTWLGMSGDRFQFIQWEDESPYNIQELIEEYLYDNRPKLFIDGQEQSFEFIEESEETEVKDLQWMKEQLEKDYADGKRVQSRIKDGEKIEGIDIKSYWRGSQTANYIARCYLEDLDEPEVLSQEWIDENKTSIDRKLDGTPIYKVREELLQNLLVPKQELPVIPKFVAEWIEETKPYKSLRVAFEYIAQRKRDNHDDKLAFWVEEGNSETFARAWLDGYEIEQEPKYYAKIKGHENIASNDKYWNYNTDMEELSVGDSEVHPNVISEYMLKATKDEWANLGINDDNAEFELVEELEEC